MRILRFIKYYFEPNGKYVRSLAFNAAKRYFKTPVRNKSNPYPSVIEYDIRRSEFIAYQRRFNHLYRHKYATDKLNSL